MSLSSSASGSRPAAISILPGAPRRDGWSPSAASPGTTPDPDAVRAAGLAFAQGRDEVGMAGQSWEEVARMVSERPERLEELPGDFGFIRVQPTGEATVVRSAGGLVPFYVAGRGGRWTVATTMANLLRFHPGPLGIDPLINAIWTSGYDAAPDRRTFVAGVKVLGRGEYVRLGAGKAEFGRWWDPRRTAEPRPSPEHAERLRSALVDTLERELDPDGENLLALSGGVDSSAVGALAAGLLGREVSTLTSSPSNEAARDRDLGYIDALDEAVGFRRRRRRSSTPSADSPCWTSRGVPFHVLQPYLCLLPSVARDWPVTVLVGGEFADHTVGSLLTLRDWARHTTPAGAVALAPGASDGASRRPPVVRASAPPARFAAHRCRGPRSCRRWCAPSFASRVRRVVARAAARRRAATTGRCPTWRCSSSVRASSACTGR